MFVRSSVKNTSKQTLITLFRPRIDNKMFKNSIALYSSYATNSDINKPFKSLGMKINSSQLTNDYMGDTHIL